MAVRSQVQPDFYFDVIRGYAAGYSVVNQIGAFGAVDTTTISDLWPGGGVYPFQTTDRILQIQSTSIEDDNVPAGTGARFVTIEGLDMNLDQITETVNCNGTGTRNSVLQYLRVNRFYVSTAGSTGANVGTITLRTTPGAGAQLQAQINPGDNLAYNGIYTVPNGRNGVIADVHFFTDSINNTATAYFSSRSPGGVFLRRLFYFGGTHLELTRIGRTLFPAGTDLKISAVKTGIFSTMAISGLFRIFLE